MTTAHDERQRKIQRTVTPAPHEVVGYLNYRTGDLDVFHALRATVASSGGEATAFTAVDGRPYRVRLTAQEESSPIDAPAGRHGFHENAEKVREVKASLRPVDGVGGEGDDKRDLTFKPRWPGQSADGQPTAFQPDSVGISIFVQGPNESPDAYPALVEAAVRAFDVAPGALSDAPMSTSCITRSEWYVRARDERAGTLTGPEGVLARIDDVAEADERSVFGSRRAEVAISPTDAGRLIDDHELGKVIKVYYPREKVSDADSPLRHPKVCVRFDSSAHGGAIKWDDREQIARECRQLLLNILSWGEIPVRRSDCFVTDHYFDADERTARLPGEHVDLVADPTEEIAREQVETVADPTVTWNPDLHHSDVAVLDVVTDGGRVTVGDLAERTNYSERTVYRAVSRLSDVLTVSSGVVRFTTRRIRSRVASVAKRAKDLLSRGDDGDDESPDDVLEAWKAAHGVAEREKGGAVVLELGEREEKEAQSLIADARLRWKESNRRRPPRIVKVVYQTPGPLGEKKVRTLG